MNDYEAKRAARAERYRQRAEAARREARRLFHETPEQRALASMQGEPIKIGHHSERRHRKLVERAHRQCDRACEEMRKAEYYESRARAVENNRAISSDDPDALEKLRAKLADLEHTHARMKAVNAAHRRFLKAPESLDDSDLSDEEKALVRAYKPAYSWEPHPYPPYALRNSNANIKRVRQRIAELERQAAAETREHEFAACRVVENADENRVQMIFPGKPSTEVRRKLKAAGFRWSRMHGAWQRHLNAGAVELAKCLAEEASRDV